jgi:head-tail adaptor
MRSGKLDRRLQIERQEEGLEAIDEFGRVTLRHQPVVLVRAELLEHLAQESTRPPGASTEITLAFRMRYRPCIRPGDRARYCDQVLEIREVKDIGRRKVLEIVCKVWPS